MSPVDPFPTGIRPMLATAGDAFDSPNHIFEVKWDGIRALAYKDNDRFWMETRNLKPALPQFPELHHFHRALQAKEAILDGEIVIFGPDGRPDFDRVRSRNAQRNANVIARSQKEWPASFVAFDCLYRDGQNLINIPLRERKQHLDEVTATNKVIVPGGVQRDGIAFFQATAEQGLEGMVAKHLDSPYQPGKRSSDWIKVRNRHMADCVIGGYIPKGDTYFKSLLLGLYCNEVGLYYMGNVGTGFRMDEIAALRTFFDKHLSASHCPFIPESVTHTPPVNWLKPTLVCTVEFLTVTGHGHFRHATFKQLHPDKDPRHCTIDSELPQHLRQLVPQVRDVSWLPK